MLSLRVATLNLLNNNEAHCHRPDALGRPVFESVQVYK